MPENVQSRFTVLDRPTESPGRCLVCGAVNRPVVDFGVDIDWADLGFGRAYLCITCILQAASKFDNPETEKFSRGDFEDAVAAAKAELTSDIHRVLTAFSPELTVPVDASPELDEPETVQPEFEGYSTSEHVDYGRSDRTDLQVDSDDRGEGPTRVPSNSGDGRRKPVGFDL